MSLSDMPKIPKEMPPLPAIPDLDLNREMPPLPNIPRSDQSYFAQSHSIKTPEKNWVNSSLILRLRGAAFNILSLITRPFNAEISNHFNFRGERVFTKLNNLEEQKKMEALFGKCWMPGGINMVQKPSTKEDRSYIETEKSKLKKEIQDKIIQNHPNAITVDKKSNHLLTEGICFGIMTDLADHYINQDTRDEALNNLFAELDKGGSQQAEIYQGAIGRIKPVLTRTETNNAIYSEIENSKENTSATLSQVLPHVDKQHQINLQGIFNISLMENRIKERTSDKTLLMPLFEMTLFPSIEEETAMIAASKDPITNKEIAGMGITYLLAKVTKNLEKEDRSNWVEKDKNGKETINIPYVQSKMIEELNRQFDTKIKALPKESQAERAHLIKRRNQLIGEVKLSAAMAEKQQGKQVQDPILKKIIANTNLRVTQKELLSQKGLVMNSTSEILGNHIHYADNQGYLKNFHALPAGFYFLSIKLKDGAHAVSVIKEADGSGYIIDPNNRKLKFNDDAEGKDLLLKLVNSYPEPETKIADHPYHKLEMYKIEKKI